MHIYNKISQFEKYQFDFKRIFGFSITPYADPIFGFDITKFDEEIDVPVNSSCENHIRKEFGSNAVAIN